MKRYLLFMALVSLGCSSLGFAVVNHQLWDVSVPGNNQALYDFHADKLPGMDVTPDQDLTLDDSDWNGDSGIYAGDDYTANMWGWVTVPATGEYTWHVSSDDHSGVFIGESMDEIIANWGGGWGTNPNLVCEVTAWNGYQNWGGNSAGPNWTSAPQQYTEGQTLALYACMREGTGGDSLSVGWTPPGGSDIELLGANISNEEPAKEKASLMSPMGSGVLRDVELVWRSGEFTTIGHDVYLSESFDDVNDRAADALVGDDLAVATTTLDVGRLEFGKTYYWTVDEIGTEVYPGKVGSFTIEAKSSMVNATVVASSEMDTSPASKMVDGSGLTDGLHDSVGENMWLGDQGALPVTLEFTFDRPEALDMIKVWNSNTLVEAILGFGAKDIEVQTSADGVTYGDPVAVTLAQAMGVEGSPATDTIDMGGEIVKSLKVTINNVYGPLGQPGIAEVQFFALPAYPRNVAPADGTSLDGLSADISWLAARDAAQSKVVLSQDKAAVEDGSAVIATLDVPVRENMSYTATGLDYLSLYYYKVIDVNGAVETASPVMALYTPSVGVIDDMEMYKDEELLEIWAFWADGYDDDSNGSVVGNGSAPETGEVYQGSQSMPMEYDNTTATVSEATQTFDTPVDLTAGNPDNVGVYFKGVPYGFNAWFSVDGPDFFSPSGLNPVTTITMTDDALIGLALTSHDTANPHTAVFSEIKTSGGVSGDWTVEALGDDTSGHPADIGSVSGGTATLNAAGDDIWGNQDAFVYAYKQLTGDGVIEAKVETLEGDNGTQHDWAKAGVMIRDSNARNSTQAFMAVTGVNGIRFQRRENTGGASSNDDGSFEDGGTQAMGQEPAWVKIERVAMNTGAEVYLTITDSGNQSVTIAHPDPEATRLGAWTLLEVPLSELAGINAASVKSIAVGVRGAGAVGKIYVDYLHVEKEPYMAFDLFGHYALEGDAMDSSGSGNHGMIVGDPNFIEGPVGQALEFGPTSEDYVDVGNLNPSYASGELSVALWAKWNGLSGQWQGLIGKRQSWSANMMWQLEAHRDSGNLSIGRNGGSGLGIGTEEPNLVVGEWTHIAFSTDGANGLIYENGVETNAGAYDLGTGTGADIVFGACQANGGNPFNGALDEVYIYDRVITADEVATLATP